jgi:endonuclease/exonuclease/phosphatase family metal-dependent hydrolase
MPGLKKHLQQPISISVFNKISVAELRNIAASRKEKKLSGFNRFVLWINYLAIICLLIAVSAKYISPSLFWLPAFFGLAFPIFVILNFLFVIFWLIQFKQLFFFSVGALLISAPTLSGFIQFSGADQTKAGKSFKVCSFNSMLFDLYNWTGNHQTRNNILELIDETNPDILCLQEFYTSEEKGDFNNVDTLTEMLSAKFSHIEFTTTLRGFDHWGIATFSKYPIINRGKILFNTTSNNICIYSDIVLNKDTVRVYNIHLQSISFSHQDNKFLEEVLNKTSNDELQKSKNILRRLKRAFLKRTEQVEMVKAHMKTCRFKLIVCGDFNDTPASYAYNRLSSDLKDAFVEKGNGLGKTYAGKWPQFRIDYILHSKEFRCINFERSDETFTDHYLISANILK